MRTLRPWPVWMTQPAATLPSLDQIGLSFVLLLIVCLDQTATLAGRGGSGRPRRTTPLLPAAADRARLFRVRSPRSLAGMLRGRHAPGRVARLPGGPHSMTI